MDDLFPDHLAVLTPPPAPAAAFRTTAGAAAGAAGAAGVMSAAGVATSGATSSHTAVVDAVDAAIFLLLGDPDALRFELVSPTGARIDAAAVDPTVAYVAYQDDGFVSHAGYHIEQPAVGTWTLEVTGTDAAAPDGTGYAVAATLLPAPAGGVVLTVAADKDLHAVGETVTITATITADGVPVTDATASAIVGYPDGSTRTELTLAGVSWLVRS